MDRAAADILTEVDDSAPLAAHIRIISVGAINPVDVLQKVSHLDLIHFIRASHA